MTSLRKFTTIAYSFSVTDSDDGKTIFNLKCSPRISLHGHRVLLDAAGKAVLTLRRKSITAHDGWQVFRGDSKELKHLIFSVTTELDVFLANNNTKEACDFKVEGSLFKRLCVFYAGESRTIAAQKHTVGFGEDNFMFTVYPNVDCAFIVALILTVDQTNQDERQART